MTTRRTLPLIAILACLAACDATSVTSTGSRTPGASATPVPSASASAAPASLPAAPSSTAVVPGFPTIAAAHQYGATQSALKFQAPVVTDTAQCPTQQGAACYVMKNDEHDGTDAAYFIDAVGFNPTGAADLVYLYKDSAGWHWLNSLGTQMGGPQKDGFAAVTINSGCANVRTAPSTTAGVVICLKNGETVNMDGGPTYADGHIWWHLSDRKGWIAHDSLIPSFAPGTQS